MSFLQFLAYLLGWRTPSRQQDTDNEAASPEVGPPSPALAPAPAAAAPEDSEAVATAALSEQGGGSFLEDLRDDLDEAIGAAFDGKGVFVGVDRDGEDPAEVGLAADGPRDLFASIAANYARPIKNFMFELQRGNATKEWLEICRPVMKSIIDGAESMEFTSEAKRMADFSEALSSALASEGREFDEDNRTLILSCYEQMVEMLPDAFVLGEDDQRREGILIHSLLRQIPEVGRVTIEKLYGAGLTSLDALFLATVEYLTTTAGVSPSLCERICDKVQEHRERVDASSFEKTRLELRARLAGLLAELEERHESFERIADEESPALAAEKRECRRGRQACALKIHVVLAEMDELDLIAEIKYLSFEKTIERLGAYLAETAGPVADVPRTEPVATTHDPGAR